MALTRGKHSADPAPQGLHQHLVVRGQLCLQGVVNITQPFPVIPATVPAETIRSACAVASILPGPSTASALPRNSTATYRAAPCGVALQKRRKTAFPIYHFHGMFHMLCKKCMDSPLIPYLYRSKAD